MDPLEYLARCLVGGAPWPATDDRTGWRVLVSWARSEAVSPLLYQAIRASLGEAIPAAAEELLTADYREAVLASIRLEAARGEVCRCLHDHAIPTLLLKGAALAWSCYVDAATRPMTDLDLLIPANQVDAAARCLEANGFEPHSGSLAAERRSPRGHLIYRLPATGVPVELHWELRLLGRARRKAVAELWAGARPAAGEGSPLLMRSGHTLPLLCAHMLLQHREPRLIWLHDLHRLLLTLEPAEAALATEAAARWKLVPCTALALRRVRDLFGTPLPAALEAWAGERAAHRSFQARVAADALTPRAEEAPSEYVVSLLMNRNYPAWRILFPTPEELRQRLDLAATQPVGPGAYATFAMQRLWHAPRHLRQLWRLWHPAPPSSRWESPACRPEAPRSEEDQYTRAE